MPPLGMLKLQVLFAWVQLLCSLVVLSVMECWIERRISGVSSRQCCMEGLLGFVLSAPGKVCAQEFCVSQCLVYKLVCFM